MDDAELLRRFVRDRDESAFARLVEQHVDWVYSAALRQLHGDAHLARDAVQLVFTNLAAKASRLTAHARLGGWLFTTTRFVTAKLIRTEQRRRAREQEASAMQQLQGGSADHTDWEQLRPVVDDALDELAPDDRDAVLLRFFENRDYTTIGARLAVSANTARMRVDRALDRLNAALARRGIRSTAAAVATTLGAHAVGAAPAGLATTITTAAIAGSGAAIGGGALAGFFTMSKIPLGLTAAVVLGGTTTLLVQRNAGMELRAEVAALRNRRVASVEAPATTPAGAGTVAASTVRPVDSMGIGGSEFDAAYAQLEAEATTLANRLAQIDRATARALGHAPISGEVHELRDLTVKPQPLRQVPPQYPFEQKRAGETGDVLVEFTIDASGRVRDLNTIRASHEAFAQSALEAVAQWAFRPGELAGLPVNTRMRLPIVFNLQSEPLPTHEWF